MKNIKNNLRNILILMVMMVIPYNLNSFPGDHNSLTCDTHFINSNTSQGAQEIKEQDLIDYYRKEPQNETERKARQDIINKIKLNKEIIKTKIRNHHDFSTDVTKFGDSLSDLVDLYGAVPFDHFGFVPPGDFGNEPGYIDSWGDYFTIFSNSYSDPITAKNYGISGETTSGILGKLNSTPGDIDEVWDILPTGNHCIDPTQQGSLGRTEKWSDPSAPRTVLMAGGNDLMFGFAFLPFVDKYKIDMVLENITFLTDWNIENGKQILLEGTLPVYSHPVGEYNSLIVNRVALCKPIEDSLIEPDEIPWFVCAYNQGVCRAMIEAAMVYNTNVLQAFAEFNHRLFVDNFSDSNSILPWGDYPKIGKRLFGVLSIQQACVNDRLAGYIGPSYESVYPNNVKTYFLYSHFNKTGIDIFAQNFWVPIDGLYNKYPLYRDDVQDSIHVGPYGYKLWGNLIGSKLNSLGWNKTTSASEMPDPVIELEGGGPGRKVRKKAKEVDLLGKESSWLMPISSESAPEGGSKYGGFYKSYWDNNRIYIQQINNASAEVPVKERYGEAYHLHGTLLGTYLETNGITSLGFPLSDVLNVGPGGTYRRIYFECGYMTHNTLNIDDRGNYTINGRESCPVILNNNQNYEVNFENCLTEGECAARWFEDYVFQLRPTSGNSPFRFQVVWYKLNIVSASSESEKQSQITNFKNELASRDKKDAVLIVEIGGSWIVYGYNDNGEFKEIELKPSVPGDETLISELNKPDNTRDKNKIFKESGIKLGQTQAEKSIYPGIVDRVGRLRGGPTNDPNGHWTIKVRMTDARDVSVEKDVHISTGW
ncbi:MAG: hypothetical protein KDK90_27720 [Leptospiraceae bacterium]|nr:hypothetical protein [Leptospiraceae bacterium]